MTGPPHPRQLPSGRRTRAKTASTPAVPTHAASVGAAATRTVPASAVSTLQEETPS
ncbi:hypothetical protein [Streptomyces sp. NPDC060184]|uniref:hypothetical protein n=1 Tax=Streptomyces sp. NPDC060184 TaxID=3347064 RepID=UPI00364F08EE